VKISLGTKNSVVDIAHTDAIAGKLRDLGHEVEIVRIPAAGDSETVGQLRLGLMRGDFDLVVHRMHRIPSQQMPGLTFAAILKRNDSRDALVARDGLTLEQLPEGSVVATRSVLRRTQLMAINPGLEFIRRTPGQLVDLLGKVHRGELDAVVAGAADFAALDRLDDVTEYLDLWPAGGLGAVGLECRSEDTGLVSALQEMDHPDTRVCVMAERAVYGALKVSPAASLAARARREGVLSLSVAVLPHDGSKPLTVQLGMPTSEFHAVRTARKAAAYLRLRGAEELGREPRIAATDVEEESPRRVTKLSEARILVPREEGPLARGLRSLGLNVTTAMLQRVEVLDVSSTLEGADWVVFTSIRAVESIVKLGWTLPKEAKVAAVGAGVAGALREMGYHVDRVPEGASGVNALLSIWPEGEGTVLIPGSALFAPGFVSGLQAKGWNAQLIPVYTMQLLHEAPTDIRELWEQGAFDAVVITSGSNAFAVGRLLGWNPDVQVFAVGESAVKVLERAGVHIAGASDDYSPQRIFDILQQTIEG
jgi:hydroxymethylbilane synthase